MKAFRIQCQKPRQQRRRVPPNLIHWHRLNSPAFELPRAVLRRLHANSRLFAAEKSSSREDSQLSSNTIQIAMLLPLHPQEARPLEPGRQLSHGPLSVPETIHETRPLQCDSVIIPLTSVLIPLAPRLRHLSAKENQMEPFPLNFRLRPFSLRVFLVVFEIFPLPPLVFCLRISGLFSQHRLFSVSSCFCLIFGGLYMTMATSVWVVFYVSPFTYTELLRVPCHRGCVLCFRVR